MEVIIRDSAEEVSVLGAKIVARLVRRKPRCVLGLATGRTPLRLYLELIRLYAAGELDFSGVETFNLDEYVGLPPGHPQSYHFYMRENFFRHVNIPARLTHIPDGCSADLRRHCLDYETAIKEAGGIDLQLLGIGSNGHIGFNEPTGSLNSRTWIKILSEKTLKDNAALFPTPEEQPRHVISMGIGTILEAGHCVVLACGAQKSSAVKAMIEGPVSSMCPASALQLHPRATVIADSAAAARLDHSEHYRWIEQHKLDWQKYE
ncbi:MAG TPA: glucosamine-6-phosphate deaminase [Candidatus Methylacidiphilales bacterium]|nr:glucosamine-6-phosphate deaminase [Candidatus Methylacidiphilales bacterium]